MNVASDSKLCASFEKSGFKYFLNRHEKRAEQPDTIEIVKNIIETRPVASIIFFQK
jgi:hypothetical protein